jgi:hypothetical protein
MTCDASRDHIHHIAIRDRPGRCRVAPFFLQQCPTPVQDITTTTKTTEAQTVVEALLEPIILDPSSSISKVASTRLHKEYIPVSTSTTPEKKLQLLEVNATEVGSETDVKFTTIRVQIATATGKNTMDGFAAARPSSIASLPNRR